MFSPKLFSDILSPNSIQQHKHHCVQCSLLNMQCLPGIYLSSYFCFFITRRVLGCVMGEITLIFYSGSSLICLGLPWLTSLPFIQGELSKSLQAEVSCLNCSTEVTFLQLTRHVLISGQVNKPVLVH